MSNEEIENLEKWVDDNLFGGGQFVGLKKRGHWWMQNSSGYTSMVEFAGRYTREEAARKACPHDEPVTIHEFPIRQWARDKAATMQVLDALMQNPNRPFGFTVAYSAGFPGPYVCGNCCGETFGIAVLKYAQVVIGGAKV